MSPDHQDRHFKQLACDRTNAADPEFLELISIIGFHSKESSNMPTFTIVAGTK